MIKTSALLVIGCAMATLAAAPAQADVFSSQSFSGGTTTLDKLPGVNLDATPGFTSQSGNCVETEVPSYHSRYGTETTRGTTCSFGNFSITTTGTDARRMPYDTTYGGNPPPWEPAWRP